MTDTLTDALPALGYTPAGDALHTSMPPAPDASFVLPLTHLGVICIEGEERAAYLQNLCSNEVVKQPDAVAAFNSFNSPKGRMLASMLVWKSASALQMMVSGDLLDALLKRLRMYVLRTKATLSDARQTLCVLGVAGTAGADALASAGLPVPLADMDCLTTGAVQVIRLRDGLWLAAVPMDDAVSTLGALRDAGLAAGGTADWQLANIRAGLPLISTRTQELFVAQMLNYELIGGVSFKKGCYPGQEIIARTRYLGKLKKRMYRVSGPGEQLPEEGTDIFAPGFGDQSAGQLVNVAPLPDGGFEALAVLQIASAEAGELHLASPDGPALQLLSLPYPLDDDATAPA